MVGPTWFPLPPGTCGALGPPGPPDPPDPPGPPDPPPRGPPWVLAFCCSSAWVRSTVAASSRERDALCNMGRSVLLHSRRKRSPSVPFHATLEIRLLT
ncbi:hypothetical protein FQP90_04550 [Paenarthrobacter nitroguajacolicus]|uniref:Uncharacterized protein n=1 Tax=Paenarthrobacter nitroguajacolicus TaxID=211146 RepID=A0A558H8Q5_PAENT|nr:hypothetical protein FQP90_04550 [Paenarthrobacter nitroguajacolicus]